MKRIVKVFYYIVQDTVKAVLFFYLVIALVMALSITLNLAMPHVNIELDGMRLATTIFLFVAGLNAFKSGYLFLQANGVTRRHYYWGGLLAISAIAAALTAVDAALYGLLGMAMTLKRTFAAFFYPGGGLTGMLLWSLALNLLAVAFGWFVTMLYYRCGKWAKFAISLSPAAVLIGLPIISDLTGGKLLGSLANAFTAVMGLGKAPNAFIGAFSMAVAAAAAFGLCFLLILRAPVKEQDR